MTRERERLDALSEDVLTRIIYDRARECESGTFRMPLDVARYIAMHIVALAATPEPEGGGRHVGNPANHPDCCEPTACPCGARPESPTTHPHVIGCHNDPAAVRERVELRVQRRPDGRPNTEPAAMLCLRDVDDFGWRRTRFVATVAPEYIEALDAALRAVQGGE